MLKRIALIAILTGAGHLFSIWALKYFSVKLSVSDFTWMGQADAILLLIINLIAAGLQPAAMRDIALTTNWQPVYQKTQIARITLALFLSVAAVLFFWKTEYLLLLTALFVAINGDYALYAVGKPLYAALIALFRLVLPYFFVFITLYSFPQFLKQAFFGGIVISFIISSIAIAKLLGQPLFFKPKLKQLKEYITSLYLGITTVALYFLGMGLMLVVPYFYLGELAAAIYIGLKFYIILKGLLRILHQVFLKEMMNTTVSKNIDFMGLMVGGAFVFFTLFFPEGFITFFFGSKYNNQKQFFLLLGLAFLVYSMFSSVTTRALLFKLDKIYAAVSLFSAFVALAVTVILSFFYQNANGTAIGLLLGEFVFAALMIRALKINGEILPRLKLLVKIAVSFVIPLLILLFGVDNQNAFLLAAAAFILSTVVLNYNFFRFIL